MGEVTHTDEGLVALVSAVLVDPNLHTDLRMRLHEEITDLLHAAREQPPITHPPHHREPAPASQHLPDLMHAVLSDPNLHTDMRMRLYQEIPELVRAAREHAAPAP